MNRLTNVGQPSQGRPSFLKKEAKILWARRRASRPQITPKE
jgi:hypothetical protein